MDKMSCPFCGGEVNQIGWSMQQGHHYSCANNRTHHFWIDDETQVRLEKSKTRFTTV